MTESCGSGVDTDRHPASPGRAECEASGDLGPGDPWVCVTPHLPGAAKGLSVLPRAQKAGDVTCHRVPRCPQLKVTREDTRKPTSSTGSSSRKQLGLRHG